MEPFNLSPRQQTVATPYSHSTELIGDLREAAIDIGYGIYKRNFGFEEDSSFDITEHLRPQHYMHQDQLSEARSKAEFDFIYQQIRRENKRMQTAANAPWTAHVAAMPYDYTNLIPGVVAFKSPTLLSKISNASLSGFALQSGIETARYLGGANYSTERAVSSVVMSTAFSAAVGGSVDLGVRAHRNFVIDAHRNFRDTQQEITAMENLQQRVDEFAGKSRETRTHGKLEDNELAEQITYTERRIFGLEQGIKQAEARPPSDENSNFILKMKASVDDESSKLSELVDEQSSRLIDNATVNGVVDPFRLANGTYNPIPNPMSSIQLLNPIVGPNGKPNFNGLNMLKKAVLKMAGDYGRITKGNLAGIASDETVYIAASTEKRHWQQFNRMSRQAYAEGTGASNKTLFQMNTTSMLRGITGSGPTYRQFLAEAGRKRLFGLTPENDAEARVMRGMTEFYDRWRSVTEQSNLIGRTGLDAEIRILNLELARIKDKLATTHKDSLYFQQRLADTEGKVKIFQSALDVVQSSTAGPRSVEPFYNRIYDVPRIQQNEERFKSIIFDHFMNTGSYIRYNVETKLYERKDVPANPAIVMEAVDDVYKSIVDDPDPLNSDGLGGLTKSVKLAHRMLDIDNRTLYDFIQQDPLEAMKNYTNKTAPKYHFSRLFNGKNPEQVWTEINDQLVVDGYSTQFIDEARKNFTVLENRVIGRVYRDPTRIDVRAAEFLRSFTTVNYLGTSGFASFPDFARILMENDVGDVFQHSLRMFNTPEFRASMRDVKDEFGESLDIEAGVVQHRVSEGLIDNTNPNSVWNNIQQTAHILNFLGPFTELFKTMEGSLRQHTLIKRMRNIVDGKASQFEMDYLNRYGFSIKEMKEIVTKAPIQELDSRILPNVGEWEAAGVSFETIQKFRNSVNSGVLNTIMSGTPADRPIPADGIVYIPMRVAQKLPWGKNLSEDEIVKGYVRIESGAMTLPFQFYNYMFAAMNKVTAAYTSGQVKNRLTGAFAAIGMGYLAVWMKTPDYIWDQMDEKDKFARAFDYSGLASLYSDVMYTSMQQTLAAGGNPIMSKYVSPKFKEEANALDFVTGFTGAGTSTIQDIGEGTYNLFAGDSEQGAKMLYNTIPLTGTVFGKFITNQFKDALR